MKNPPIAVAAVPSLLFVTDFSASSLHALQWAVTEAQKRNLHVSVLHSYRLDQVRKKDNVVQSKKELETESLEKFESQMAGLLRSSHLSFDFRSEVGFLRDRIAERARKHQIVMVVVGTTQAIAESFGELIDGIEVPLVIVPSGKA